MKASNAASASLLVSAIQISCSDRLAFGCWLFGSLLRTLAVLCTQQRCELWPTTREQRCWVHKTANVLNKLPKSQQPKAKRSLQEIWMAETSKDAETAFDAFIAAYELKYDKAAECLAKDRQALLAFYDFPAEHWKHLRTSNPIESTFATVRHRTIRSKGCLSNKTALA